MTPVAPSPTFRDPAGSLSLEGELAIRTIHPTARQSALDFIASPFCLRCVQRGDMSSTEVDQSHDGLRFLHPRIAIPTYPWEWTPSQWLAAAELTLTLCEEGLADGWILKDATPLNILFVGSRPILVDVLSFEQRDPNSSVWLAYGQYIRTFLLPLLMNRLLSWPLELSFFKRDGYEPAEVYRALSWPQRLSPAALWPISLPTWLDRRKASGASPAKPTRQGSDPELTAHILRRTLASLRRRTRAALPKQAPSEWASYTGTLTHYTPGQTQDKRSWVSDALTLLEPARILDIGANTGEYSALAASTGAEVIALERDAPAAESLFRGTSAENLNIQTIHADFSRPTPSAGWENSESTSLLARLEGRCDLVMLLAVIHHLILMEQIPIPRIISLVHRLTRRYAIIEWVPVSDPMFQSLMRGRDTLYAHLTQDDLLKACDGRFTLIKQHTLDNGRILFLFEKS